MKNKVNLIGRLTRDPEVRYTPDGTAVCNFSMATSESWKDKGTGEKKEKAEFHRCVAWRRLGEVCGEYLFKGKLIDIEGKLQTRSWEQDGTTRYTTEILVSGMIMLPDGKRKDGNGSQKQEPPKQQEQPSDNNYGHPTSDQDDDIPF